MWPEAWRQNLPWAGAANAFKRIGGLVAHVEEDCTNWTTVASPIDLFKVTGDVLVRVFGTVQTGLTSTANNGTIAAGVEDNTGVLLPATTVAGVATRLDAGEVWVDADSDEKGLPIPSDWVLVNDTDIILTVGTNNITAGAMTVYCEWIPLSDGARVEAA